MQKHASEMKIVTFAGHYYCFITFCCFILFYFIPCHVLSIMMFKCTLMKEQINHLKSNQHQNKTKFMFLIFIGGAFYGRKSEYLEFIAVFHHK